MNAMRILTVGVGALVLGFGLACSGGGGMSGHVGNKAACEKYVEHMNSLPCLGGVNMDKDQTCSMLDQTPINMESYYECLVEKTACDGQMPKISVDECKMPSM